MTAKTPAEGEKISDKSASEIALHSSLDGPIKRLNRLQRSLLFAEISMVSYMHEPEVRAAIGDLGFAECHYIDRDGAQAYVFVNEHDRVIVCRGTEPNEWNDIKADANAFTDLAETVGRVHRGFKREVDDIWPSIEEHLVDDGRVVWFTGHSLGGAMATICAGRCLLSAIAVSPHQTYTYGSPRVGTKRYVTHADVDVIRWVNNNDIVTHAPPTWLRYRHVGTMMYLNAYGNLRKLTPKQRAKDRWRGFIAGLKNRSFDHFSDHAIARYVEYIARAAGATD